MKVEFSMPGASDLAKMLSKLPLELEAKILKKINMEAAKMVQAEVIKAAPSGSEIPDEIKIKADPENSTGVYVTPSNKVFFARFIEYGTVQRKTKKGYDRGAMSEKPFIRPTILRVAPDAAEYVTKNYAELINKYLEKEVKAVNRKNKKNGL